MEISNAWPDRKLEAGSANQSTLEYPLEEPLVAWEHDQGFRRAILAATENELVAPPTPTQQPRPISKINKENAFQPRKRICRHHRSLPPCLRNSSTPYSSSRATTRSGNGSYNDILSSKNRPDNEPARTQLDILLEQFKIHSSTENKLDGNRKGQFRSRVTNCAFEEPKTKKLGNVVNENIPRDGRTKGILSRAQQGRRLGHSNPSSSVTSTSISSISSVLIGDDRLNREPSIKAINSPRSSMRLSVSPSRDPTSTRVSSAKPFQTPSLANKPGTRLVPKRPDPELSLCVRSSEPLRGLNVLPSSCSRPQAPMEGPTILSCGVTNHSTNTVAEKRQQSNFTNFDVGEDDPKGDASFDSFDDILNEGGPEVEMLLRQMDGTQ
nr:hypothetical protein L204_03092 [Cryptococcus depauperatus CBS 7855]